MSPFQNNIPYGQFQQDEVGDISSAETTPPRQKLHRFEQRFCTSNARIQIENEILLRIIFGIKLHETRGYDKNSHVLINRLKIK